MWLNIRDDILTPTYCTHSKSIRVQCITFNIYIYWCYFRNAMYFKYKSKETRMMKVIPETRCVSKFHIYVLVMHVMPTFVQIKHKYTCRQWSFSLIKIVHSLTCHLGGRGVISHLPSYWLVVPNTFSFIAIRLADVFAMNINSKRLLHDIFHIGPGISSRLPYQAWQRSWRADTRDDMENFMS